MKIIARQLTIDLYNCKTKKLADMELAQHTLKDFLQASSFHMLKMDGAVLAPDHFAMTLLLQEGHIIIHTYTKLKYVAADIFLCAEGAEPDSLFKAMRNFFKPDKTKTTYLKRGDFGTVTDMKPKIKTRVAPLRRINNAGAKVVRLLARRSHH